MATDTGHQSPHVCLHCSKEYAYLQCLLTHMKSHEFEKTHVCPHCIRAFSSASLLQKHMVSHGQSEKELHICPYCSKEYRYSQSLKKHISSGICRSFHVCPLCSERFADSSILKEHMLTHIGEKTHMCPQCYLHFTDASVLKEHMDSHNVFSTLNTDYASTSITTEHTLNQMGESLHDYQNNGEFIDDFSQLTEAIKPDTEETLHLNQDFIDAQVPGVQHSNNIEDSSHVSPLCNQSITESSLWEDHIKIHTTENPDLNMKDTAVETNDIKVLKGEKLKQSGDEPHMCPHCKKGLTNSSALKEHMKTHSKEKPCHVCSYCGKFFTNSSILKQHMFAHSVDKVYQCKHCLKKFSLPSLLKNHMLSHSGRSSVSYVCRHCDAGFTTLSSLKEHVCAKVEQKPHVCPHCDENFSNDSTMQKHMKTHRKFSKANKEIHICVHCNKNFVTAILLENHLITHTVEEQHVCPHCHKAFGHPTALKNHVMLHTDAKPFACTYCPKKYIYQAHLKNHLKIHSFKNANKNKRCPVCGKTFKYLKWLKSHLTKQHHTSLDSGQPYNNAKSSWKPTQTLAVEQIHLCPVCKEEFSHLKQLNTHFSLVHKEESLYSCCLICVQGFVQPNDLEQHMKVHATKDADEIKSG